MGLLSAPRGCLQFLLKWPPQAVQDMDAYFLPGQQKHIPLIPTLLPLQVGYDGGSYNMVKPQVPWTLKGRALYQVCTPKNLGGHLRILPTTQCCAVLCCAKLLSCVRLFVTPWPVAHQAPLSMGDSSGKNTGVSCHALLQGIFPTQGSNPGLLHSRQIVYRMSHQRNPRILEWVAYPFSRASFWPRNRTGSPPLKVNSLPAKLSGKPLLHNATPQKDSRKGWRLLFYKTCRSKPPTKVRVILSCFNQAPLISLVKCSNLFFIISFISSRLCMFTQLLQSLCLKKISHFSLNCLASSVKIQLAMYMWVYL